jgi:hypothetical protein
MVMTLWIPLTLTSLDNYWLQNNDTKQKWDWLWNKYLCEVQHQTAYSHHVLPYLVQGYKGRKRYGLYKTPIEQLTLM